MRIYEHGDRVKLTERFARVRMKRIARYGRCAVDWTTRVGTVKQANAYFVWIIWDGRSSADDPLPLKAVEKVGSCCL
jgi:hypothetical protein